MSSLKNRGFTLIELLVTISIASIMITLAIPAMTNFVRDSKLTSQANDLVAGVRVARSEAIKRGEAIILERKGGNWGNGWEVKSGVNILKEKDGEDGITSSTVLTSLAYTARGVRDVNIAPGLADAEIKLCDVRNKGRLVTLTGLGGFTSVCWLGYGVRPESCAAGSCP